MHRQYGRWDVLRYATAAVLAGYLLVLVGGDRAARAPRPLGTENQALSLWMPIAARTPLPADPAARLAGILPAPGIPPTRVAGILPAPGIPPTRAAGILPAPGIPPTRAA